MLSGLASGIGERELQAVAKRLQLSPNALHLRQVRPSLGPGNALSGFLKRIDKTVPVLNVADVASLEATVKSLTSGS